jgi:mRNA-degrading endonuclease toxin of MazEF toxin-antitoxin module
VTPGQIVAVNWRDALPGSGEPNKVRPGVVVSSPRFFGSGLRFEIVVPLTGAAELAVAGAAVMIPPTPENGCTKPCYALAWNVQTVPHSRLTETPSRITSGELENIRAQIAACASA